MAQEGSGMTLQRKTVVLGVTGSIAAYKAPTLARKLQSLGAEVTVVMTEAATCLVDPLTFRSLTGNAVLVDMFAPSTDSQIEHIALAERSELFLIAPATANIIGKIAAGIADNLLTCAVMATQAPVLIAPAMNVNMYQNPLVQGNIEKLSAMGYRFVGPKVGTLATGIEGQGALAELDEIAQEAEALLRDQD
jgi:phosphopantothenoylcysteine decarboxylase/phosphopantothenate--cysteine ligase